MTQTVHRITDCNGSLHDPNKHLSIQTGFSVNENAALIFTAQVIDSQGVVLLRNSNLVEYSEEILKRYQNWNPIDEFQHFKNDFETQDISSESIAFMGLMVEVSIEIKGPIGFPEVYGVVVHMSEFILMESYYTKDTGTFSVSLLCKKQDICQMLDDLHSNLLDCLATIRQRINESVDGGDA
jgi:hypothetical protein